MYIKTEFDQPSIRTIQTEIRCNFTGKGALSKEEAPFYWPRAQEGLVIQGTVNVTRNWNCLDRGHLLVAPAASWRGRSTSRSRTTKWGITLTTFKGISRSISNAKPGSHVIILAYSLNRWLVWGRPVMFRKMAIMQRWTGMRNKKKNGKMWWARLRSNGSRKSTGKTW